MKKTVVSAIALGVGVMAGFAVGSVKAKKEESRKWKKEKEMSDKHFSLFLLMDKWTAVKQNGKNLSEYFEQRGYKKIAIYGMSYVGKRLVEELKNGKVEIRCGIDKNVDHFNANDFNDIHFKGRQLEIYSPEEFLRNEDLRNVDAVVVTSITFFNEIEAALCTGYKGQIIDLEEILYAID